MSNHTRLAIYTDGASRGNPGPSASGVHIIDDTTSQVVANFGAALGIATNNVAEYQAVLDAMQWLFEHKELLEDDIHLRFCLDSRLVVEQLVGHWKIKDPKMRQLAEKVKACLRQLPGTHEFAYIPREENKDADRLANEALEAANEY